MRKNLKILNFLLLFYTNFSKKSTKSNIFSSSHVEITLEDTQQPSQLIILLHSTIYKTKLLFNKQVNQISHTHFYSILALIFGNESHHSTAVTKMRNFRDKCLKVDDIEKARTDQLRKDLTVSLIVFLC